jgi:hypothetical protein
MDAARISETSVNFTRLHDVTAHNLVLSIVTAVTTSYLTTFTFHFSISEGFNLHARTSSYTASRQGNVIFGHTEVYSSFPFLYLFKVFAHTRSFNTELSPLQIKES